jgi:hypothetical protein
MIRIKTFWFGYFHSFYITIIIDRADREEIEDFESPFDLVIYVDDEGRATLEEG